MRTAQRSRSLGSTLLAVVVAVSLAGCASGDSTGSTTTPAPSSSASVTQGAAGCADVVALKSSVQTLRDVEPLQDGLNALEAAITDTKTSLDTAVGSVTAELQPAVEQVKTQLAAVQAAADGLSTDNLKEKAPGVVTALRGLEAGLTSLAATLSQECPGS